MSHDLPLATVEALRRRPNGATLAMREAGNDPGGWRAAEPMP
jgi:hypothetical protein